MTLVPQSHRPPLTPALIERRKRPGAAPTNGRRPRRMRAAALLATSALCFGALATVAGVASFARAQGVSASAQVPATQPTQGQVLNGQLNLGATTSTLNVELPPAYASGGDMSVTATAVGNSFSATVAETELLGDLASVQIQDAAAVEATIEVSRGAGASQFAAAAAAIANSAALTVNSADANGGAGANPATAYGAIDAPVSITQFSYAPYVAAAAQVGDPLAANGSVVGVHHAELSSVAVANAASVSLDEHVVGFNGHQLNGLDTTQVNESEVAAIGLYNIVMNGPGGDDPALRTNVLAVGNALTIEMDDVTDVALGGGGLFAIQETTGAPVTALTRGASFGGALHSSTVAIANSIDLRLTDKLEQDLDLRQSNRSAVDAGAELLADVSGDVAAASAVAVANTATVNVADDWVANNSSGGLVVDQLSLGERVSSDLRLTALGATQVSASATAIANSASVRLSDDFFRGFESNQVNAAEVAASATVAADGPMTEGLVNAIAVGNSLSVTIGAD